MAQRADQKSIRVVMPLSLYKRLREQIHDYGDISRLVRSLLNGWLIEAERTGASMPPVNRLPDPMAKAGE